MVVLGGAVSNDRGTPLLIFYVLFSGFSFFKGSGARGWGSGFGSGDLFFFLLLLVFLDLLLLDHRLHLFRIQGFRIRDQGSEDTTITTKSKVVAQKTSLELQLYWLQSYAWSLASSSRNCDRTTFSPSNQLN